MLYEAKVMQIQNFVQKIGALKNFELLIFLGI